MFYDQWNKVEQKTFFNISFGVPHLATCVFLFFYNEPELGVRIDPGMALTPLPYLALDWDTNLCYIYVFYCILIALD